MAGVNLPQNRYFSAARNCTILHTTGAAANRYMENPLKPAEFEVLGNSNFDWLPVYQLSLIQLVNRYPCFDKAVEFEGATLEVLANRNQPVGQLIRFRSKEAF